MCTPEGHKKGCGDWSCLLSPPLTPHEDLSHLSKTSLTLNSPSQTLAKMAAEVRIYATVCTPEGHKKGSKNLREASSTPLKTSTVQGQAKNVTLTGIDRNNPAAR